MYVDLETANFKIQDGSVHQIGAVFEDEEFKIDLVFDWLSIEHELPIDSNVSRWFPNVAIKYFIDWIKSIYEKYNIPMDKKNKIRFCGKNPKFDWERLAFLFKRYGYNIYDYFHYTMFDLDAALVILKDLGLLESGHSIHLDDLIKKLNLPYKPHDALEDAKATREIYEMIINNLKNIIEYGDSTFYALLEFQYFNRDVE